MSLVTVNRFRNQLHPRKFDHDEMRRLRAEDPRQWTYEALAEHFGVSEARIGQLLNPNTAARQRASSMKSMREKRRPCLGGCGRLVWTHGQRARTGYCTRCLGAKVTADEVREHELHCRKCDEWKPDSEFPRAKKGRGIPRRGKRTWCRSCCSAARADYRRRHPQEEKAYERSYALTRTERRNKMALYVVLSQVSPNGTERPMFEEIGTAEAVSPDLAIEQLAQGEGSYVAIPRSRFEVVLVAPQTALRVVART